MATNKQGRLVSFVRLSKTIRFSLAEKKLGYKGEISKEAKELQAQLRLIKDDFGELQGKEKIARREEMEEFVKEILFLRTYCTKVERQFQVTLDSLKSQWSSRRLNSVTSAPSNRPTEKRKSTGVRSDPLTGKKVGFKKSTPRGKSSKFEWNKARNSSTSFREPSCTRKFQLINIIPLETMLKEIRSIKSSVSEMLSNLEKCCMETEARLKEKGSVCGVYNPDTGRVEWREMAGGGVYGVWNPRLKLIEWKEKKGYGVHGVYNPVLGLIEWKFCRNGGIYGVWDPELHVVKWKESYREGVCGVWHPVFEQVVFKTFRNGGIVGWFDEDEQDIKWKSKKDHGVCVVRKNSDTGGYDTICSTYCGWIVR